MDIEQRRLIAFCEILGFSDLLHRFPLANLVDNVLGPLRKSLHHSLHNSQFPSKAPSFFEIDSHPHVGVAWFSDSILLWTRDDSDEATKHLLATLGWLHFETTVGIPRLFLRSAVAYGVTYIDPDNRLFLGKPIVDAYRLEEHQEWSGGALAESALSRLPQERRRGVSSDWWLIQYEVPLKRMQSLNTLAINWPQGLHRPGWRLNWSASRIEPTPEERSQSADIVRKFENTRSFHSAVCQMCFPPK